MDDESNDGLIQVLVKRIMGIDGMGDLFDCQIAVTMMAKGDLLTAHEYDVISSALEKQRRYILTYGTYTK